MPLPTPTPEQSKDEFLAACMGDATMTVEFPETAQRLAVCQAQWSEKREGKLNPHV